MDTIPCMPCWLVNLRSPVTNLRDLDAIYCEYLDPSRTSDLRRCTFSVH